MTRTLRTHPYLTATIAAPLVVALALTGGFMLWLNGVRMPFASGSVWFAVTKTAAADYTPAPGQPVFILALGNDGRPGDAQTRGDAIHVIGVNPTLRKATILDFPRDTGLPIPGHGMDKVNASHVYGGAALEAQTLGNAIGVTIPYAIDTNFGGFVDMINDMGGLQVNVPEAMNDDGSGAHFPAGPLKMSGATALAFARNRHQFPTGDLKRSENQGYLITQALAQLRGANTGPVGTLTLLANLGRHAQLEGIGLDDLYALGRLGLSIDPANVRNVGVPVTQGSGTRLNLGAGSRELFADFADDAVLESH
jgi:polyisoprenyl-teichoic acid--peptidoglycan teichoic acid transferase